MTLPYQSSRSQYIHNNTYRQVILLGCENLGKCIIFIALPISGIASEVTGKVSLTIIMNTVRDNNIVTPTNHRDLTLKCIICVLKQHYFIYQIIHNFIKKQ